MMTSQRKSIVLLALLAFFVIRITAMLILRGLRIMVSIIKRRWSSLYTGVYSVLFTLDVMFPRIEKIHIIVCFSCQNKNRLYGKELRTAIDWMNEFKLMHSDLVRSQARLYDNAFPGRCRSQRLLAFVCKCE